MVVGAFPAAKLGVLLFKQISKPIANIIKHKAKDSPVFRRYVCMPPAQFYNWCEVQAKMWSMNLGKPVNVPKLNEAMAIELGANLLGEVIIFVLGAGVLLFEVVRTNKKETMKELSIKQDKVELELQLNELTFIIERQDAQLREIQRCVAELESKSWLPKKPKIITDAINKVETFSPQLDNYRHFSPDDGILFNALYFIETEFFARDIYFLDQDDAWEIAGGGGIVSQALSNLNTEEKKHSEFHIKLNNNDST